MSPRKQEEYKVNHPQIAPDVRDGLRAQSVTSDIFSFGRIIFMISNLLNEHSLRDLSKQCMLYDSSQRPCIHKLN